MPDEIAEALKNNLAVEFLFNDQFTEIVASETGGWFIWWVDSDIGGEGGSAYGNKKPFATAEDCWGFATEILKYGKFTKGSVCVDGRTTPYPAPWKYNHGIFSSYEQYLEIVLGIRSEAQR